MCSSNFAFEELVLRSLRASPLMKPFLTPGEWQESKCVYWKVSVGLKCVRTSRIECFLNHSLLYTHISKNVISVSEISAVNSILGWKLFASSVKLFIASLFVFHREKMSSMYLFQMSGLFGFWLMISVSSSAIKMLAKDTTIFVPIAVPFFPLKWKESSFKS